MNTPTDNLYDRLIMQLHKSTRMLHRSRYRGDKVTEENVQTKENRAFSQVPRSQIRLLKSLAGTNSMPMKEIVEMLDIRPSSASELVSKLEARGYVTRKMDSEDKRVANISITEEGRVFISEVDLGRNERFSALFSGLTQQELEELVSLLEKLNDSMRVKVGPTEGKGCRAHHGRAHHGHRMCHRHMER
ncbi:MAG: MarR family transcriptional regulator [Coriobacteriaceae bacterium]|nr:MarR family transcriptional regulator [Coriobacteriaceae bacterium]